MKLVRLYNISPPSVVVFAQSVQNWAHRMPHVSMPTYIKEAMRTISPSSQYQFSMKPAFSTDAKVHIELVVFTKHMSKSMLAGIRSGD